MRENQKEMDPGREELRRAIHEVKFKKKQNSVEC